MTNSYELHATITPYYIYHAIVQSPVISNNGNTVTYIEIGIIENGSYTYYRQPKEALISNCPFRLLSIAE